MPDDLANARLLFLVCRAKAGDVDAGRVVVARVLPGLIALACRVKGPFEPSFDECLASVWLVIAGYPVDRRPAKVAANLLYETEHLVRSPAPATAHRVVPLPPDAFPAGVARLDGRPADAVDEPLITLLDLLRDARDAGLSDASLSTLIDLGIRSWSPERLGPHAGITDRAVRYRRSRALRELRQRLDRDPTTGQRLVRDGRTSTAGGPAKRRAA